ncbi:MAG: hypothetical protein A2270_04780 [Elusimicrobia bacterium RIFOXYA12_FULL_51_18]|nr:MAG: hypothetical protein A2270_04780 [Elusimicrobia bacterium RIFOXYA12_FULL_51_18]OGS32912.1 MAG: hypothetical protein A2218_10960 [Elusimicrobia bacterium RIFOXYA2_FULL_53_38]
MKYKLLEPLLVLAVFSLDRLAKFFILKRLYLKSVEVLPFLKLTYVQNTGVAFGMFRDSNNFFIVFSAILIVALLLFRRKVPDFAASGGHFFRGIEPQAETALPQSRADSGYGPAAVSGFIAAKKKYWRHLNSRAAAVCFTRFGLALVLGGALGNLYDRLAYGFVVDFFDLSFFPAVFNVADSAITAGAVLLAMGLNSGHGIGDGDGRRG